MTEIVILDTSIFIDDLRTGRHQSRIDSMTGLLRTSSVVIAELWRGARTSYDRKFLQALEKNHPVLVPTQSNWIESGRILARMGRKEGFTPDKLRDLHFDVLIALSARSHGARLVTANRADFELISSYRKINLEIW